MTAFEFKALSLSKYLVRCKQTLRFRDIRFDLYELMRNTAMSFTRTAKKWTGQMAEESKDNRFYDNQSVF